MTVRIRNPVTATPIVLREATMARSTGDARRSQFVPGGCLRFLNVLVVDDDRDSADSLTMLVRLWGHHVRTAYGGAAAIQMALDACPDVLLLDVAMPIVTGLAVAHRLRGLRRFDQTRIVAMSGYVDEAHQKGFLQAGFDDFLAKPLDMATLECFCRTNVIGRDLCRDCVETNHQPPAFTNGM